MKEQSPTMEERVLNQPALGSVPHINDDLATPEQISVILDSITDSVQVLDREWRMTYMNSAARKTLQEQGIEPATVHGKHFFDDIFPTLRGSPFEEAFRRVMQERKPTELENFYSEWNRWFSLRVFPVENGGLSIYFQDISSRKKMEAALRESEAKFRASFENAAMGISLVELNGQFRDVNQPFCEMIGYSREELLEKTFSEITHPEDIDKDWKLANQVLAGELTTYTLEKRYIRKGGALVWVCLSVSLIRNAAGAPQMFVSMIQDIDKRKRAEEAIRLSEERFELAARATHDAIWDWDLRTDSLWWSEALETQFGHKGESGMSTVHWWFEQIHPTDRERVHQSIHSVIEQNQSFWREEYKIMRQDGSYADVLDRGYVLRDGSSGKALRMIGAMQDLSERKRALRLEAGQRKVLELIARDSALPVIFDALIKMIEEQSDTGLVASILLLDADGTHLRTGAAPNLPKAFSRAVDGFEVGPQKGSCGTAAFLRKPVYVSDIQKSPLWSNYAEVATAHGLRACWSTPIISSSGQLLGTLALYHFEPCEPKEFDLELVNVATQTASIAIERKRSQEEVSRLTAESEQQRRLYETILSSTPDLVYVFDRQHRFTYANEALLRVWGRTREESIGKTCLELGYEPWHAAMHDREIEQVIATKQPIRGEVPFMGANGARVYDYIFVPVIGANGEVEVVAGTTHDVTEKKEAKSHLERIVAERTAQLKATIAELETFSYSVSHDLRSPLRAMQGYSEELLTELSGKLSPEHLLYLERINRAAERLDRLTQEVLTYSHLSRSEIELKRIGVAPLVRTIVEQYPNLQDAGAQVYIEEPLPDPVGHEAFLTQAISNLLTNAVKFVPTGVAPKIIVRGERVEDRVRLWIEDNGIGIEPRHYNRIFQMFGRVHPESKYEGTGIGLAIVKKCVERMNGSVGFESIPQQGSRFWIELPAAS